MRYSQEKELISIVFYCFKNPLIACKFGTTYPIQVGFSAKCTSPIKHSNQIENWKCHMFKFRLIALDHNHHHITYNMTNLEQAIRHCFEIVVHIPIHYSTNGIDFGK